MARTLLAAVCVLLVTFASPLAVAAFDAAFGVDACGGASCCCRDAASCAAAGHGRPSLISSCRCGHHENGPGEVSPESPRVAGGEAVALPEFAPRGVIAVEAQRFAPDRRAAPETPPPRERD